jgi:hypothetical protein
MKILFTLLVLLFAQFVYCQSKGDSKIVVVAADTSDLFNRVVMYFYEHGYTVAQKDPLLGFVATDEKGYGSVSIKVNALVKGSTIVFTSMWASNISLDFGGVKSERNFSPVKYGGVKGSDYRLTWDETAKIAKAFGEVSYSK